jgi:pimeloyl-ACP methyl ester carboxylesterase
MLSSQAQVDEVSIHYWMGGQGPSVLLFHSALGDAEFSWSPIWSELERHFTVVAPDMPGFGQSENLKCPSIEEIAHSLKRLVQALNTDHLVVIGNSLGVAIAIELARQAPQIVYQIILVDGLPLPSIPRPIRTLLSFPGINKIIEELLFRAAYGDGAIKKAFPFESPQSLRDLTARIKRSSRRYFLVPKACFLNSAKQSVDLGCRVNIVWGAEDKLTPLEMAYSLQKQFAVTQLSEIRNAGHLPQRDQPKEFVDTILSLIGRKN